MASQSALFTATRLQTLTYLLAVCPFSIAFLVFINASISFVITDLIGIHHGKGDVVGTLGFADELLALAACPVWGVLSDRIGVRHVCTAGYVIIALALVLFVQAKNIYPQLLLGRLLFSLGGSAVSTMVTAVLPAVTGRHLNAQAYRTSMSSELTITPNRFNNRLSRQGGGPKTQSPSSKLAGFVGMFAGCGALVSLAVFLPLPARFENSGLSPAQAIERSYYVVGGVALLMSICCFVGLQNLPGEENKSWKSLFPAFSRQPSGSTRDDQDWPSKGSATPPYWKQLSTAIVLGFQSRNISLGYVGGFVARASSVGISLFIPLFVNHYYRASGLCDENPDDPGSGLGGIKRSCRKAYILASILTGVSQLIALIAAPAFGYLSAKSRRYNVSLLFAALAGIVGYITFPLLPSPQFNGPDGNAGVFVVMALLGISQIGAIVCSLAVLSSGILSITVNDAPSKHIGNRVATEPTEVARETSEEQPLLGNSTQRDSRHLSQLKGSIAGVYSLYGGAGILLLTKLGGLLFDVASPGAPFYIMAGFNGILLLTGIICGVMGQGKSSADVVA